MEAHRRGRKDAAATVAVITTSTKSWTTAARGSVGGSVGGRSRSGSGSRNRRSRMGQASSLVFLAAILLFIGALALTSYLGSVRSTAYSEEASALLGQAEAGLQRATVAYVAPGPASPVPQIAVTNEGAVPIMIQGVLEVPAGNAGAAYVESPIRIQPGQTGFIDVGGGYSTYVAVTSVGNTYTVTTAGGAPTYALEWAWGTPYSYQGAQTWFGATVEAYPGNLSDLNTWTSCSPSSANSEGYTAVGYVEFYASSVEWEMSTDDASAVFIRPADNPAAPWTSVYGSSAWQGQGAPTSYPAYTATVSVQPLTPYEVAVDWVNGCGPGASLIYAANTRPLTQFSVVGWEWTDPSGQCSDWTLPCYQSVAQAPGSPPTGAVPQQEGTWVG